MKTSVIYNFLIGAALLAAAGCAKDDPFIVGGGQGKLSTQSMSVDIKNRENLVRGAESVDVGKFRVDFVNQKTGEVAKSYKYGEMPEIVALPEGSYKAVAEFGDNKDAEWEEPYYLGNSATFEIRKNEITSDVDPVECSLSNIRMTVTIDDPSFGPDVKVTVKVGDNGSLDFTPSTNGKSGYFRKVDGSNTITATFSGTVDGNYVNETKTYDNADAGNHYKVNFSVHKAGEEPGALDADITVDAKIQEIDENHTVDQETDYLEDDMRPEESRGPKPEILSTTEGFTIGSPYRVECYTVTDENGEESLNFDWTFDVVSHAEGGITGFSVNINSSVLDPETLQGVGLAADLDLVNPGIFEDKLNGLGFPTGDDVKGKSELHFDLGQFGPLLAMLADETDQDCKFTMTVKDANGKTTALMWLVVPAAE